MNPNYTRRLIGGASALFGVWWLWISVFPYVRGLLNDGSETGGILALLDVLLTTIPGVLAVKFGIRLFRVMNASSLKWVVGVFATLGSFVLSGSLAALFPDLLPESFSSLAFLFLSSLVVISVYLFVVRKLLWHLAEQDASFLSLISRGVLMLMAWHIWILLGPVIDEYSPIKAGYTQIQYLPWKILEGGAPAIIAFGSYHIFASLLIRAQQGAGEQPDTAGESK